MATAIKRKLFHSGHIVPVSEGTRPCSDGMHEGPLLRTDVYEAHPEVMWRGFGECRKCGSTIHRSELRAA